MNSIGWWSESNNNKVTLRSQLDSQIYQKGGEKSLNSKLLKTYQTGQRNLPSPSSP